MILGMDFVKILELLINLQPEKMSTNYDDKSWIDFYVWKNAKVTQHYIELTYETLIWWKPRGFSVPVNREIERQSDDLKSLYVIEISYSASSSPIVLLENQIVN